MKISQRGLQLLTALLFTAATPLWAGSVTPSASQGGVSWQINTPNGGGTLRVSAPDGSVFERPFASGESPSYVSPQGVLPDGQYSYEIITAAVASATSQDVIEGYSAPSSKESGGFRVLNGTVLIRGSAVEAKSAAAKNPPSPDVTNVDDTLNITGLNVRINFNDDSVTGAGNPDRNWQIRINELSGGTANFFGIVDQGADTTGGETGTIPFRIDAGAPTDSMHVSSGGRLGIGTAVPATNLHIATDVNPTIRLDQTNAGIPRIWDITANSSTGFRIRDITAGTVPITIESVTGNVGLGTQSPAGSFHLNKAGNQLSIFQSSDNMAVQFRLQTNSTNRRFVALNSAGTQQSQLVFNDNGAFDFLGGTASDVRMTLIASGNVGIGTTAPTQKLSVNGTAGKPGGGSWSTFSDERLKDIKGDYQPGLEAVLKLHPIRYEYKKDNAIGIVSEGEHIGFGAAAVQKIIPEAVTKTADGYLMVDNDPILWTMLNAIKEQNKMLQQQTAEIAELKGQLQRLQAEVVLNAGAKKSSDKGQLARAHR